jgi:hypothetical protein
MSRSGVKGTALESVVADINRLVEEGTIKLEALEARVETQDLEILESKIQAALWYPLDSFGRMTELLLETEGHGDKRYLIERGRRAAERIVASGVYTQLSSSVIETYGDRVGRVMVTLGPAMYRDTTWKHDTIHGAEGEERIGFRVTMTAPVDFPDVCRHATEGFISYLTERTMDVPYIVRSERQTPQTLVFEGHAK